MNDKKTCRYIVSWDFSKVIPREYISTSCTKKTMNRQSTGESLMLTLYYETTDVLNIINNNLLPINMISHLKLLQKELAFLYETIQKGGFLIDGLNEHNKLLGFRILSNSREFDVIQYMKTVQMKKDSQVVIFSIALERFQTESFLYYAKKVTTGISITNYEKGMIHADKPKKYDGYSLVICKKNYPFSFHDIKIPIHALTPLPISSAYSSHVFIKKGESNWAQLALDVYELLPLICIKVV